MTANDLMRKVHAVATSIKCKSIVTVLIAAMVSLALIPFSGCSTSFVIGTKSNDATKITMKNEIGQAILEVAVVDPLSQEASEPLAQEAAWDVDVTAEVYVVPVSADVTNQDADGEEASDIVVEPLTSLQLTTIDGMTYTLHQLNVDDIKDATIKFEDGTAYLTYTSIATGEEVNTLDAELAYQEQVKAAEEAARQQAEQERQEQERLKQQSQQNQKSTAPKSSSNGGSSSSDNSGQSTSSSGGSGGNAASSGEDSCVDDLILN